MGNQQAKVDDWELGWLCGFIDGEGSFMLVQATTKKLCTIRWLPRIAIANTDIKLLNKVTNIIDRLNLPYHVSWRFPQTKRNLPSWQVRVSGYKRVKRWLITIAPYLLSKTPKAEMMLDFINLRQGHSERDSYNEAELETIKELRVMNHQLAPTTTRRTRQAVMV